MYMTESGERSRYSKQVSRYTLFGIVTRLSDIVGIVTRLASIP